MPCAYSEESTCHAFYSDVLTTAGIGDRFAKVSVHFEVVLDCLAPMIGQLPGIIGTLPSLLRSQQHPSAPSAACFSVLDHDLRCASQDLGDADSKKTLMTKLTQVRSWQCRDDRFERRRKHERTH